MIGEKARQVLLEATGREELAEALAWIASDYPFQPGSDPHLVLRALATLALDTPDGRRALQLMARRQSRSDLDSAAVLFRPDLITPASRFRHALERLAYHSPGHRLFNVNASALIAAQREEPFTISALCAVAGLSYGDLAERVAGLPGEPTGHWSTGLLRSAFAVIDEIVTGKVGAPLPNTMPTGPLDLMPGLGQLDTTVTGWAAIETEFTGGVPYEVLLAQRAAGGTWLAHRNATSGMLNHQVATTLCDALAARGVAFRRSTLVGGDDAPSAIQDLARRDKQIGVVALDPGGRAAAGVVFASARDSGTASKSAARLRAMKRDSGLPIALVLTGRGWSARNETADLVLDFGGLVYTELGLEALADELAGLAGARGGELAMITIGRHQNGSETKGEGTADGRDGRDSAR